jgi:PPOX class probable F420-dependent enzyme
MVDFTTDIGKRALQRLEQEQIGWLVTVGGDGTPQPSPVWFLWDGESCLIYSDPRMPKVRNIEQRPQAALHFNSDDAGGNIIILTGTAALEDAPPADKNAPYLEKYSEGIKQLGITPEGMAATYSATILFRPAKLRGH